ncbi:hypothetical protein A8C56_15220 [Niabella ginsenosidivorans]|uniref:histidine kinase n=1 Tax=Niabella ginsenosidivorans TaxID=1176587 RepID=A0A1A9I604_9BACT|nr:ATP-binding protein [Niabella ginsenosidivorans]ANH82140.1 hypothetical protein A8C56_15220 [Niabella ginsenosidivorans]
MIKRIYVIVLYSIALNIYISVQAQTAEITGIRADLQTVKDSLHLTDLLNRLGFLMYEKNIDSTFFYTRKARAIAARHDYQKGEADALTNIGVVYDVKGYSALAIYYYNKAFKLYKAIRDTSNQVQVLMNIGSLYHYMGKERRTRKYFNAAFHTGAHLQKDSIMSLLICNYLLAYSASLSGDSIAYYSRKAQEIALRYKDQRSLLVIHQIMASRLIEEGRRQEGLQLLAQTIDSAQQRQLYFASLDMIITMGDYLTGTDIAQAVRYYQMGLDIVQKSGYTFYKEVLAEKLYNCYLSSKKPEEYRYFAEQYIRALKDEKNMNAASSVDYVDYAIKEEQLEAVSARDTYQRWLIAGMLLLSIAGLVFTIIIKKNLERTRKLNRLVTAQNDTLQETLKVLEQSNAENAKMMKVIVHDLRGPISGINAIAGLLLTEPQRTAEDAEMFELVKDSSQNLLDLTDDILALNTKPGALKKEPVDIGDLLHHCVALYMSKAREKGLEIHLQAAPVMIKADRQKLWRVASNLISNAIKFSPAGAVIHIDLEDSAGSVLIGVKDEGIGVPDDIKNRIFDLHTSAKRHGTAGEPSFGMGLSITRQIVEAHGGSIWVESDGQKGSCFFVKLPKE